MNFNFYTWPLLPYKFGSVPAPKPEIEKSNRKRSMTEIIGVYYLGRVNTEELEFLLPRAMLLQSARLSAHNHLEYSQCLFPSPNLPYNRKALTLHSSLFLCHLSNPHPQHSFLINLTCATLAVRVGRPSKVQHLSKLWPKQWQWSHFG